MEFTPGLYNVERRNKDITSVSQFLNTSNIPKYITNFTTAKWIESCNFYDYNRLPDTGYTNVSVNCTCGDGSVSKNTGPFYPCVLRRKDTFTWVAVSEKQSCLNQSYNPPVDFDVQSNASLPHPLGQEPRLSNGTIVGITIGVVALVLFLARCLYNGVYRKKNAETSSELLKNAQVQLIPAQDQNIRS
ncbi:lysM domain receptor-like kinase 3 [Bidens hawaiensis]|uniref:lysM domain receptor-like kinase 3 n=1 Tax=Bidens hawaiensis TaxID=980011 RepID=UPI00404B0617